MNSASRPSGTTRPERHAGSRDLGQLRRLLGYTRPYRVGIAVAAVATLLAAGFNLVFPQVIGRLVDASFLRIGSGDTSTLDRTVLLLILVFALQALFTGVQTYLLSRAGEGVVADLRRALYAHLLTLSPRFFENRRTGELTSRLTSDVSTVQGAVSTALAQLFSQTLTLTGAVVILVLTNPRLSLVMLSIVPLVVLAGVFFGRRLRRISREYQDRVASANASAEEAISGIRVVQSFTAERVEAERYGDLIRDSFRVALKRARLRAAFMPTVIFAMFSSLGVVLWYGGRLVLQGDLTPGQLISFLFYTITVAASIGAFTGLVTQFQEALGASSRIFELLDTPSDLKEAARPTPLHTAQGRVTLEGVNFTYGDHDDRPVLRGLDLDVKPGEIIALVGPSGAGKSTLVALVPRFYDVTAGRVLLDGVDVRDLALRDLRAHVGIVPQETQLFSGSLRDNIAYGRPGATQADIEAAARAANAHDFIVSFPDGYDTMVGERGVKLSGGQRQRVAIARALLKDPRVLILDEATSALDSESEAVVQEAVDRLMIGRTTLVIAHRLSTVRGADRIVVLDGGRVQDVGSHDELMQRGGLYRDLHERQFRSQTRAAPLP